MNLKKRLQQQAEKDAEVLLDEDDELFIQQLVENDDSSVVVRPQFKKSKKFWAVLASAVSVVVAIVVLPVVLAKKPSEILYQDANIRETVCQLQDIQQNSKYFQIGDSDIQFNRIVLSYDSVTNDKLFYSIDGSSILSRYKINIVVNEKYDLKYDIGENLQYIELSDYILSYEKVDITGMDFAEVGYNGLIKIETELIYIQYQQVIDIGEQAFFDEIESIIKVKN